MNKKIENPKSKIDDLILALLKKKPMSRKEINDFLLEHHLWSSTNHYIIQRIKSLIDKGFVLCDDNENKTYSLTNVGEEELNRVNATMSVNIERPRSNIAIAFLSGNKQFIEDARDHLKLCVNKNNRIMTIVSDEFTMKSIQLDIDSIKAQIKYAVECLEILDREK